MPEFSIIINFKMTLVGYVKNSKNVEAHHLYLEVQNRKVYIIVYLNQAFKILIIL